MRRFYQFILGKNVFVYLLAIFITLLGIFSTLTIMREAYPKVEFGTITVSAIYPGASPEEVEQFVVNEIETNLKDIEGIDTTESISAESRGYVILTLYPGEDEDAILTDVQAAVNRTTLPEDVDDPIVTKLDSGAFPIVNLSVTGVSDYATLRMLSKLLEDKLIQLPGVGRIDHANYLKQEYKVQVNPTLLRKFYIAIKDVIKTIQDRSINMPGGKIEKAQTEKIVRSIGEFNRYDEVDDVVIRSNDAGRLIRISDVAHVTDGFEEQKTINRADGVESIDLTVIKKESADIVTTIAQINELTDEFVKANESYGLRVVHTQDLSIEIDRRLSTLYSNAVTGIIIVFCALFLFLNFKVALRVAIGIPFSILSSMIFVNAIGITVNLVSLLGFILVIGMIVDNAIVVGENIFDKFEKGASAKEAAIEGAREVVLPIIFSTLTTVAAFSPLLLMGGIMGKFVWSIPVVVILAIMMSLFYALIILPNLMNRTLSNFKLKARKEGKTPLFEALQNKYDAMMRSIMRVRYAIFPLFVAGLIATLMLAGSKMDFVLFPNEDAQQFHIRFEGPTDMRVDYLGKEMKRIENIINKLPKQELEHHLTTVGKLIDGGFGHKMGSNLGEIIVFLTPGTERDRRARDIIDELRKQVKNILPETIHVTFEPAQKGPPVGKPVKVDILGENFDELNKAGDIVKALLAKKEGISDIESSFRVGKPEIQVRIDEEKSARAKLTMMNVATEVRSAMGGTVATELRRGDEEIDIRVIYDEPFRKSEENLRNLQIPNAKQQLINIESIAEFSNTEGLSDISHYERKRVISITADIDPDITTSFKVNAELVEPLKELNKQYPNLQFLQRGENEDTQESIQNLFVAFVFALFLIFMIIASYFNRLVESLVILFAIPFGIMGVILAFFFHDAPISFMMMMGTIGLSGVVVNNTIILVSVIIDFRNQGLSDIDSIIEGGKARLRAVVLTSLTTLLGLFPTAYGIGGADEFIIPLCLALAWGILFSTILTLMLLPCMYALFDDLRNWIGKRV